MSHRCTAEGFTRLPCPNRVPTAQDGLNRSAKRGGRATIIVLRRRRCAVPPTQNSRKRGPATNCTWSFTSRPRALQARNPTYGGAYAYGKTEQITSYAAGEPRQTIRRKPREHWLAFIPNAHDGYVSWEQFERVQAVIAQNTLGRGHVGAAQRGAALLAGLLHCRRCGHKLLVGYTGNGHDVLRYYCRRGWLDNGEPRCISFAGLAVDHAVSKEILRVVQPAAIEAARLADTEQARQLDDVAAALQRDLRPRNTPRDGHRSNSIRSTRTIDSSPMNSNGDGTRR